MNQESSAPVAWPLALAAATISGTLAIACMMPFVAVATLAAATMPRRQAVTAVAGIWAVNQLLGFGLLGYPLTFQALSWGAALGGASVTALFVARRVLGGATPGAARLAGAFALAFAGYEALLFGFAPIAGGTETFMPGIVLALFANDALWLIGLAALRVGLTRAAPRAFGRATLSPT